MSTDVTQNAGDLQPKPMKGKYDGRKNNGRYKSTIKRGPKPLYLQHISRNRAALIVKEFDSIESWPQIVTAAWEKHDIAALRRCSFNQRRTDQLKASNSSKQQRSQLTCNTLSSDMIEGRNGIIEDDRRPRGCSAFSIPNGRFWLEGWVAA